MKWECKKCIIFDSFWQRWWLIPYEYTCATHALHRILRLHWKQFFRKRGKNSYPGIVVWFQTIISISFFIKGSCKCPMRSVTHYLWHFVNRANLLPATSTLFFNDRRQCEPWEGHNFVLKISILSCANHWILLYHWKKNVTSMNENNTKTHLSRLCSHAVDSQWDI